jgi:hypothetical protein
MVKAPMACRLESSSDDELELGLEPVSLFSLRKNPLRSQKKEDQR